MNSIIACESNPNLDWWSWEVLTCCWIAIASADVVGIGSNNFAVTGSSSADCGSSGVRLLVATETTLSSIKNPPRTWITFNNGFVWMNKNERSYIDSLEWIIYHFFSIRLSRGNIKTVVEWNNWPWKRLRLHKWGKTRRQWKAELRSIRWRCACRSSVNRTNNWY